MQSDRGGTQAERKTDKKPWRGIMRCGGREKDRQKVLGRDRGKDRQKVLEREREKDSQKLLGRIGEKEKQKVC